MTETFKSHTLLTKFDTAHALLTRLQTERPHAVVIKKGEGWHTVVEIWAKKGIYVPSEMTEEDLQKFLSVV